MGQRQKKIWKKTRPKIRVKTSLQSILLHYPKNKKIQLVKLFARKK